MLATSVLTLQQSQATLPGSTIMAHSMSTFQPVTAPMVMTHFQAPPTQGPLDSNRPISPKLPRYIEVPRESAPDQGKQQQSAPDQGNKQQNKPSSIWRLPWKTPAADRSAQNGNTQPLPTFLPPSRSPSLPPLPPSLPPSSDSVPRHSSTPRHQILGRCQRATEWTGWWLRRRRPPASSCARLQGRTPNFAAS